MRRKDLGAIKMERKYILAGIVIVAALVLIYFIYFRSSSKEDNTSDKTDTTKVKFGTLLNLEPGSLGYWHLTTTVNPDSTEDPDDPWSDVAVVVNAAQAYYAQTNAGKAMIPKRYRRGSSYTAYIEYDYGTVGSTTKTGTEVSQFWFATEQEVGKTISPNGITAAEESKLGSTPLTIS